MTGHDNFLLTSGPAIVHVLTYHAHVCVCASMNTFRAWDFSAWNVAAVGGGGGCFIETIELHEQKWKIWNQAKQKCVYFSRFLDKYSSIIFSNHWWSYFLKLSWRCPQICCLCYRWSWAGLCNGNVELFLNFHKFFLAAKSVNPSIE